VRAGDDVEAITLSQEPLRLRSDRLDDVINLHVASGPIEKQVHLPTGRVSIESILRLLLDELEVPPVRAHAGDYGRILDKAEGDFIEHRSWHA